MKISIFYFSGTGNTWWVSERLKELFISQGHNCETYSIENYGDKNRDQIKNILNTSDIIGVGFPVYASSIPIIMKHWVKDYLCTSTEEELKSKRGFVFDTMALFSGDTPLKMKKLLKKCGWSIKQAINIRMLSNLPQMPSMMTWGQEKQQKIFKKAEDKCEKLVKYVIENKKWLMRRDPISRLIGWFQRVGLKYEGKKIKEWYYIDEERCNLCKNCVNSCPIDNLSIKEIQNDLVIEFGDNCVYCMRCFNFCPQDAIIIMERTKDTEKYRRFRGQIPDFKLSKIKKS